MDLHWSMIHSIGTPALRHNDIRRDISCRFLSHEPLEPILINVSIGSAVSSSKYVSKWKLPQPDVSFLFSPTKSSYTFNISPRFNFKDFVLVSVDISLTSVLSFVSSATNIPSRLQPARYI